MDVTLIRAARQIYDRYCQVRPEQLAREPLGVVIHQVTLRGNLVYRPRPALLPQEAFVPMQLLSEGF